MNTSVLDAYRPLANTLKACGIYPTKSQGMCVHPSSMYPKIFHLMLVTLVLAFLFTVNGIEGETDVTDYTTMLSFWAVISCAIISITSSFFNGDLNRDLKQKWCLIDRRLGIEHDARLKSFGNRLFLMFLLLTTTFLSTSITIVFYQRRTPQFSSSILLVCMVLLLCWHNATILLPQLCYFFYCRALQSRFYILGAVMHKYLSDDPSSSGIAVATEREQNVAKELQGLRHSYHLLTEMTNCCSQLFSPMILLFFLLDSGIICICMYRIIQAWNFMHWSAPLEMITILTAFLKILMTTILGSNVTQTAKSTLQTLPKTSYENKTEEAKYQAHLFSLTSANNEPIFSASGFFKIDRRLFTATIGTVATYFVVLLQFRS